MSDKKNTKQQPKQQPQPMQVTQPPLSGVAAETAPPPLTEAAKATMRRKKQVGVLRGLIDSMSAAAEALEAPTKDKFWLVVVRPDGPPQLEIFDELSAMSARILALRAEQRISPDDLIFVHAFRGHHMAIQKGRRWTIIDRGQPVSLEGDVEPHVDPDGSLLETLSLNDVEAKARPIAPAAATPAPADAQPPPATPSPLTQMGGPTLAPLPQQPVRALGDVTQPPSGPINVGDKCGILMWSTHSAWSPSLRL